MLLMKRSRARAIALQLLFQRDHNPTVARADLETYAALRLSTLNDPAMQEFCLRLYDGVVGHLEQIDAALGAAAENWRLVRMAAVDRNVLRLGAYELLFVPDTPPSVVIDEAIELSRRFGSKDSPSFVNGVLDRLRITKEAGEKPKVENAPVVS
jgi:N utilization substance protein B